MSTSPNDFRDPDPGSGMSTTPRDPLDPLTRMTTERDLWRDHYHRTREQLAATRPTLVRCKDCAAWERFPQKSKHGDCRRFAPQPAMAGLFPRLGHTGEAIAGWPITEDGDGCMEGVAK